MINDELNSRSVNFLGLVVSLDLFSTLSLVYLSILLINNKTPPHFNYLDLIKYLFLFGSLRDDSVHALYYKLVFEPVIIIIWQGLNNLLSNLAPLPGIQGNYLIISRPNLTLTILFVLFLKLFQVEFGWNWVKGIGFHNF